MDSQSQEESSGKMEHKMWKQYLRIGRQNNINRKNICCNNSEKIVCRCS